MTSVKPVHPHTISHAFTKVRDASGLEWSEGMPPTFHELRSLSKRLYNQQGVNTKVLLGHKTTRMADLYADDRGREWQILKLSRECADEFGKILGKYWENIGNIYF